MPTFRQLCFSLCSTIFKLCSIKKPEGFKCETIPYSRHFDLLDIDLLLYWWATI